MRLDRHRNKQARELFVRGAFNQIESLLAANEAGDSFEITPSIKEFLTTVRAALGYSAKTIDIDIWRSMRKTYYKLKTADSLPTNQR